MTTYTVAMVVAGKVHQVTDKDATKIAAIAQRWIQANPNRPVTLFINESTQ